MRALSFVLLASLLLLTLHLYANLTMENEANSTTVRHPHSVMARHLEEESQSHECRFWGIVAEFLPDDVVLDHLINLPYSLKNLGAFNNDGWGLAYFNDTEAVVLRGEPPANVDPNFDLAAQELAESGAGIGVGHVRAATSGASDIPNPHPFIRYKNGKWWAFGHNGGISGTILRNLIGPEYLAENPPTVGDDWNDPDVVDSDLYMLYVLKCIEENDWNVTIGIAQAVIDISKADYGAMNFFLTDGETMWGFRRGNTLYYCYSETFPRYSVIASQPPSSTQEGWAPLYDYNLIILTKDNPPSIIGDIKTIPEFPSFILLPLFMMATLLVIIVYKIAGRKMILQRQRRKHLDFTLVTRIN